MPAYALSRVCVYGHAGELSPG